MDRIRSDRIRSDRIGSAGQVCNGLHLGQLRGVFPYNATTYWTPAGGVNRTVIEATLKGSEGMFVPGKDVVLPDSGHMYFQARRHPAPPAPPAPTLVTRATCATCATCAHARHREHRAIAARGRGS